MSSWFNESGRGAAFPARSEECEEKKGEKREESEQKKQPRISRRTGVHKTFGKPASKEVSKEATISKKAVTEVASHRARAKPNETAIASVDSCYARADLVGRSALEN